MPRRAEPHHKPRRNPERKREAAPRSQNQPHKDDIPPTVAIGSDGVFYLSAQLDELPLSEIPEQRQCFVGVSLEEYPDFAVALVEFARRTEPRVIGLDGRVYIESANVVHKEATKTRGFYGYAATEPEAELIQRQLALMGMDVYSLLENRPKSSKD